MSGAPGSSCPSSGSAATSSAGGSTPSVRARSSTPRSAAGMTLFDTAEMYGDGESELFLGRALAGRRDEAVIATKFGWGPEHEHLPGGSAEYIRRAIDGSLERLGTDYIDLYQYHRPDGVTPIEETLGALDELVRAGKVRHIGSSNFSAAQVREADAVARARGFERFVSAQNEYSLLVREPEDELVPALEELGLGLIPYFPLARGMLTGKVRRGVPPPPGTRLADQGLGLAGGRDVNDADWDRLESLRGVCRGAGAVAARRRNRRPRGDAYGRVGDRGRDIAGAGARRTPPRASGSLPPPSCKNCAPCERRPRRVAGAGAAVGARARAAVGIDAHCQRVARRPARPKARPDDSRRRCGHGRDGLSRRRTSRRHWTA